MLSDLASAVRPALVLTLLFAALLGVAYPLTLTGLGQALFPAQANGSLIRDNGKVVGSGRSEEHTSELQSLMRISYAVFCLKKKKLYTKASTYSPHSNIYYSKYSIVT